MAERITYKEIYGMQAEVKAGLAALKGKQKAMAEDMRDLKKIVHNHTEKIGILRGKAAVWGVLGGAFITGIVLLLIAIFGKVI